MQKHVNLVDLVKSFRTNIYLQNFASIQKRTSPVKFAHLAEKSGKGSISNLSTKVPSSAAAGVDALAAVAALAMGDSLAEQAGVRSEVNNFELNSEFFPKIQNFRQISDLFSQI